MDNAVPGPRIGLIRFWMAALMFLGMTPVTISEAAAWSCGTKNMPRAKIPVRAPKAKRMNIYLEGVWDGRTSDGRNIRWVFATDEQRPIPNPTRVMRLEKDASRSFVGTWRGSDRGAIITYTHSCDAKGRNCQALATKKPLEVKIDPATHDYFCWKGAKFERVG